MLEILSPYLPTLWCLLAAGGLILIQLLVADVIGLSNGHVPGSVVAASHKNIHFRATRAHANTNESVAAFILLVLGGVALGATPVWLNGLSIAYCAARVAHMLFYWSGLSIARSLSFIVSLVSLFGLLIVGVATAF